jgi:DcaP outer membrane protein
LHSGSPNIWRFGTAQAAGKEAKVAQQLAALLRDVLFRLTASALVIFGSTQSLWAQIAAPSPQNASVAQLGRPTVLPDVSTASQVFPDGGFPDSKPGPAGGNPQPGPKAEPGPSPTPLPLPQLDEGPPGSESRGILETPTLPEFFHPTSDLLPSYFYLPAYYNTPGIGARALADYAPPGYEARETDEGQAPGTPEFTPITAPVPVTAEERQKFVTRGLFPGSYLVPGTDTSFRFRGFVRITGLYDFDPIGSKDDFVTNTIPVPQQSGQNNNFSARYSRLGLDTWTPTSIFEWNVHTFIEGDFFNGPSQAVGGGGNPFRLRFAFVDFGYFRVGQQNTVFMDGNAFPMTVDFAGPRGLANQRRPSLRATIPLDDQLYWAIGIEQPFSDITTNGLGTNVQEMPDFATHLRYETDFGHVQLSGIARSIGYQPTEGDLTQRLGWGLSASTVFHPWALLTDNDPVRKDNPTGLDRSRILLQYTFGWGIGRYIQDTAGQGLDGQVDPATGGFKTLYAAGWSASYEHWFSEMWLTNLTYSAVQVGSNGDQPGTTYEGAKYLAASLWYVPIRNMSIGIEYVWGQRDNLDELSGRANRINALFQYNF